MFDQRSLKNPMFNLYQVYKIRSEADGSLIFIPLGELDWTW